MTPGRTPPGLFRRRAAARAALWFEQIWVAVWPSLGVLGGLLVLALLDAPALLPPWPRLALPVLTGLLALALLAWRLRRIARPTADSVDRRLERASGLLHRPLSALQDQPAGATPEAASIWAVHQARLQAQVRRLRVGRPRPGLAARDHRALRGLLLVGLVASVGIAGAEAPRRLLGVFAPGIPAGPATPGAVVQAWVTPPAYTGLPPIFLQPDATPAPIPVGAHLTVSVTGSPEAPAMALNDVATEFHALDGASWQAERDLVEPGRLTVRRGLQDLATWTLTILPDRPPSIAFTEPPGAALSAGRPTQQTRLAWRTEDDYGVVGVQAELRLKDRPTAPPMVLKAPLSGSPKQARGAIVQDLTPHPWAGLPVIGRMVARDTPGQTAASAEAVFDLPERPFQNPVAQGLIAIRKQLSRAPEERRGPAMALDAVADQPELFDNALGVVLHLRAVSALLQRGRGQPAVDEAQARLWELALALEDGAADRTAHALEQARQAMRDAMEAARADPQNAQAQAELQRRMEELRAAIQRHIEALAEQARREGTEMPLDPNQPQMNARDLDRLAQAMQQAAKDGRMNDAKQQMAELEKLLEQLQNARPEHGEQREQRNAERRQKGQQQMDAVQDMVKREGGLLDRSQSRAEANPPRHPGQPPRSAPPQPGQPPGNQRGQDQKAQAAMRRALGELMQRFGDLTGQVPAPLGEADVAMRDAAQAMADGRDSAAGAAQQRAIEALQKGGRAMGQQLSRQFGSGDQEGDGQDGQDMSDGEGNQAGPGDTPNGNRDGLSNGGRPGEQPSPNRRRSTRRDPLGRPLPNDGDGSDQSVNGQEGAGSVRVPDQMEQARTRELQEELRRRGADRTRPQPELDYIDRLLKSF
jgi:uncharacterized protein (TIGR02302 family)